MEGAVPTEIEYRENTFSYILVHNYVIWPFQLCFITLVFLLSGGQMSYLSF